MSIRLSLCLAVILLFAVVSFGLDNARARNVDAAMNSNVTVNNVPPGQRYYYRHYYYRRHYRHYRHHRHYRHYRYAYYRR